MKSINNLFVTLLSTFISMSSALACLSIPNSSLTIAGSYHFGKQVYHGANKDYTFGTCNKSAGQYFILVNAPIYTDPLMKSISSPEGELPEDMCAIENSPFKVSKSADIGIENFYHSESSFLNNCLEAEVTDARGQIDAETQINCEVTQVSSNKVIAKGPRCAFKVYENSVFNVKYRMNPSCLNLDFLKSKGNIRPMDVKASLAVYIAQDLTPGNPNYDILSETTGRIALQPDNDLIPIAKYAGTVGSEWPMQYGTQIEFGRILLTRINRLHAAPYTFLKTPFIVNNNCPEVCKNGFCTSPCDFYAPVAARITLNKKSAKDTMYRPVDYWYQGNIVPARFLGELSFGRSLPNLPIEVGDTFMLEAEFSNPALTYKTIVDQAKQLLVKLTPVTVPVGRLGHKGGKLDGLGQLESSSKSLTDYHGMLGLGPLRDEQGSTDSFLAYLNSLVSTEDSWPPYYGTVINGDLTDNPNRVYMTLKVEFRIAKASDAGAFTFDNVIYTKESKIYENFKKPVTNAPQIKCVHE